MPEVLPALLHRLHRTMGLLFGPFLLIAALSGALYALTPQLENWLYDEVLHSQSQGPEQPLSLQIEAAQQALSISAPLAAVRPAEGQGHTTRVMFKPASAGASEHWAVFVDPVTLAITGQMPVYGTSGVLPLRTQIDLFHRELLLGPWGRWYSELAASWLWLIALGGTATWCIRKRSPASAARRWHSRVGLLLLVGLLFFSATGLTWSRYAGDNIAIARAYLGMSTPTLATALDASAPMTLDEHHEHNHHSEPEAQAREPKAFEFEHMLHMARAEGLDAAKIEIVASHSPNRAWTVNEIDRSWPTQVDAVAIDARTFTVIDQVNFADYPLAGKLTRWGIDAHMGVLFGLANQLLLVLVALGLAALVVWGYVLAYTRSLGNSRNLLQLFLQLSPRARLVLVTLTLAIGLALPVLGVSLVVALILDALKRG